MTVDFLTKEFVTSYFIDNHNFAYGYFPNDTEVDAGHMVTQVVSNGRSYYKTGKFCVQTLVGAVFKTVDKETKATRYMLQVGLAKQNQHDLRHDKVVAHETAFQHAYTDPVMTILLDHKPDFYEFRDYAETYFAFNKQKFVFTAEENEYYNNVKGININRFFKA